MKSNNALTIVARISRKSEAGQRHLSDFTSAEWMDYIAMSDRVFAGSDVVAILDVNRCIVDARRITGRNANGTFRLAKDGNAFGLEGWDMSGVLGVKGWMEHPRTTVSITAQVGRNGQFNGEAALINWADIDRAEMAATAKAEAAKARKNKAA